MDTLFLVLDVLVRIVGVIVLVGGVLVLLVLAWDMSHPKEAKHHGEISVEVTEVPKIIEIYAGMGLVGRFDYADFGGGISDRLGHCYMLAGKAAMWSRDSLNFLMPEPVAVIHGSMHGPDAAERIGHALVLLDDGRIWEPVTQGIYDRDKFETYSRWQQHHLHTISEARHWMQSTGNYGPWISV
jgi:hypothetical protein